MGMMRSLFLAAAVSVAAANQAHAAPQAWDLYMQTNGGYFGLGPYGANWGNTQSGTPFDVTCVDFYNHLPVPAAYKVWRTDLSDNSDLTYTRFGYQANALFKYRQAAYLGSLFRSTPKSSWVDLHLAIWGLFSSGVNFGLPSSPTAIAAYRTQAANFVNNTPSNWSWGQFTVLTNVNTNIPGCNTRTYSAACAALDTDSAQELITTTPEPATSLLLSCGLVGLVVAGRRRRNKK